MVIISEVVTQLINHVNLSMSCQQMEKSASYLSSCQLRPKYISAVRVPSALRHFRHQEGSWTATHPARVQATFWDRAVSTTVSQYNSARNGTRKLKYTWAFSSNSKGSFFTLKVPKSENSVMIYSPSSCYKPVWVSFICCSHWLPSTEVSGYQQLPKFFKTLCSTEERNSYKFGISSGWVNYDKIWVNYPFKKHTFSYS